MAEAEFATVLLIDPSREDARQRRLDVAGWTPGKIVQMSADDSLPMIRQHQGPTPSWRLREAMRRDLRKHNPAVPWRVYPLMKPSHGDSPFDIRSERSGVWVAFRQGQRGEIARLQSFGNRMAMIAFMALVALAIALLGRWSQ